MIRRWWIAVIGLASLRLAHVNLLWADEDYHLAAAIQILKGHVPYRDFWYDKPPLAALLYLLIGGHPGWPLRILDVFFVLVCCLTAYKLAQAWWGPREGIAAALLLAFFTTFYLTSATVPFAVDGLLLLPHLAAIYFAFHKRAFWSGVCCALGLLTNVKAIFVAATCGLWLTGDLLIFGAGIGAPLGIAALIGARLGVFESFYQQVWQWGLIYAGTHSSIDTAIRRCADWFGFHAALVAGVIMARSEFSYRFGVWFVLSCAPLMMGNHFAPRYFFQLLPVVVILGSRGVVLGLERFGKVGAAALAVLLIIPLIRFGPHYGELILDNAQHTQTTWSDAALDVDSQHVADLITADKKPHDTLFVWGYRPDIYVYARMATDGKFSDSQPLDGVPADRHLQSSEPSASIPAAANRAVLIRSQPSFIVDGLGVLNPRLSLENYPDISPWLRHYKLIGRTRLSVIYKRVPEASMP